MASTGSRASFAEASDAFVASTATASTRQLAAVADEILSVAHLLGAQPGLRRALTNPSRSGAERSELMRSLLSGKVAQVTVDVLAALVSGRWSTPNELRDAMERLAVDTMLRSADTAGELPDVEDELFRFGQIVAGDSQLAGTLSDPGAPMERRVKLVRDLLKGKVRLATGWLIEVALEGFGGRGFESSLTRLVELTAAKRDREVAYVTVAKPLSESEEERLAAKLSGIYGRQVSLKIDVDPKVIGGVSVQVGSDLYDGTILRRLNQAKQAFAK
jgi:F-type H+-transporting ATPase subunit delta